MQGEWAQCCTVAQPEADAGGRSERKEYEQWQGRREEEEKEGADSPFGRNAGEGSAGGDVRAGRVPIRI